MTLCFVTAWQQLQFCFVLSPVSLVCHWCCYSSRQLRKSSSSFVVRNNKKPQNKLQSWLWHQQLLFVLLCHWCHSSVTGAITQSKRWSLIITAALFVIKTYNNKVKVWRRLVENHYAASTAIYQSLISLLISFVLPQMQTCLCFINNFLLHFQTE